MVLNKFQAARHAFLSRISIINHGTHIVVYNGVKALQSYITFAREIEFFPPLQPIAPAHELIYNTLTGEISRSAKIKAARVYVVYE